AYFSIFSSNFIPLLFFLFLKGKCHCQPRFEGKRCEIEPCLNGGMRSTFSSNGKCYCPYGLTGEKCETVTHCVEGKGKLIDGKCKCADRWSGLFCQSRTCYNGVSVGTGVSSSLIVVPFFERTHLALVALALAYMY
ncbi:unnamed protein product, partial [Toxocara canis]|uniref:EGF-like domain-containing protein n=1 Tax=Toxocara canis TaxID=6265 RepID=A0A183U667_TOXCA